MSGQPNIYRDGTYGAGISPGFNPFTLPFCNNPIPDIAARVTEQTIVVAPACYTPKIATTGTYRNLLEYSEQFDNGVWTATRFTVTANQLANPATGALTADKVLETAVTNTHLISQPATVSLAASVHYLTISVRPLNRQYCQLSFVDSAATGFTCFFDLTNGLVLGASAGCTGDLNNAGNGFFDLTIAFTPATGIGTFTFFGSADGTTTNYAGSITSGFYLFGAALEYADGTANNNAPGGYVVTTGTVPASNSWPYADGTADRFGFLENEAPMMLNELQIANVRRTFARVPSDQVQFVSKSISRPQPRNTYVAATSNTGQFAGPFRVGQNISGLELYTADDGCLIGNCLVSAALKRLFTKVTAITAQTNSGNGWYLYQMNSHGWSNGSEIAFFSPNISPPTLYVVNSNEWSVVNTNYVVADAAYFGIYGGFLARTYSPGSIIVRARQTESFALPGVTAGISSPTDIALPSQIANDIDYFTAISGNTNATYIPYDFAGPDQWLGSIYKLSKIEVLCSDL